MEKNSLSEKRIFDYIVIGAGTAGGVIAKKLTDDKETSALVLEAGTDMTAEHNGGSIGEAVFLTGVNRYVFNITSIIEAMTGCPPLSQNDRVLGGSSEINEMHSVCGRRELYDRWAELVGNQWRYNEIRSILKENEADTGHTQSPGERSTKGPIFTRQQIIPSNRLIERLTSATAQVMGIPIAEDYNTGVGDCTFYRGQNDPREVNGEFVRSSTAAGYLNSQIVSPGNPFESDQFGVDGRLLAIFGKTTVDKIVFKMKHGDYVAVGVDFVKDGVSERRYARKGIIVSAGYFSSVILQRSGIGKTEDLVRAGIQTLIESPNVGYNLQSHAYIGMGVRVDTVQLVPILLADTDQPLALSAFKAGHPASREVRRLRIFGAPVPLFLPAQDVFANRWSLNVTRSTNIMSFGILDLNPKSRGTIMAANSDPEAPPSFTFNPLEDPDDLHFMVDQYIHMYNIIQKARTLGSGIHEVVYPPENIFLLPDESEKRRQLEDYVRGSYSNFFHFGGQCRMAGTIEEGVVDGFLNVFGTKNLKVADLSISPILPDGNPSIPAEMIGLNAVRFIQRDPHPYVVSDDELEADDDDK